jgi:hypothetical protein
MADSGTGIQELMAAETRASQIVAEARIGMFIFRHVHIERMDACIRDCVCIKFLDGAIYNC